MPRTWEPRERRYVSEWTRLQWPNAHVKESARLGAFESRLQREKLSEAELRALGVYRRYVDALVVELDQVHLVEGKIRNTPGALEQLELYERLFPLTPELQDLRGLPIRKHLVWPIQDPVIEAMARERGIQVHLFRPEWVEVYLKLARPREGSATAAGGLTPDLFGKNGSGAL